MFGGTSFRNGARLPSARTTITCPKAAGFVGESSVQLQIGLLLWGAWVGLTVLSALAFSSRVAIVARAYFFPVRCAFDEVLPSALLLEKHPLPRADGQLTPTSLNQVTWISAPPQASVGAAEQYR